MKLTVQGEVVAGTILQQSFIVEYVINHQMCDDCRRVEAKDTWNANVSVKFLSYNGNNLIYCLKTRINTSFIFNFHHNYIRYNYVKRQTKRKHYILLSNCSSNMMQQKNVAQLNQWEVRIKIEFLSLFRSLH